MRVTEEGLRTRWWVGANLGNHSGRLKDVRAVHVSTAEEAGVEAVCYLQFFLEWTAAKKEKQCTSHLSLSLSLHFCPYSDEHLESHCSGELAI